MMQEILQQKIHYTGNAKYVKDTLKVLDNDNNILDSSKYNVEWIDKKNDSSENRFKITIPLIEKEKKITVIYNVIYEDQEETQEVRNIIRAKGTNTNNAEPKDKDGVKVISKGVIKNTELEITKSAEKQEITAGSRNKYKVRLKNIGLYDARDIIIEDILKGDAKYIVESIVLSDKDIQIEHEGNAKFKIPILEKGREIIVTYEVEYASSKKDSMVTNIVEVKGSNTKKEITSVKVEVIGVKENIIEKEILPKILPKAGKRERRKVAIYAIIAFVLIVPAIIFRREYIEAKKRQRRRKRQK